MRSKALLGILISGLSLCSVVQAAEKPQASIQLSAQSFTWKEFDSAGRQLLEERGPRFFVGATFDNSRRQGPGMLYSVNGKIYLGNVDYDGQTQSGIPATTDVNYFGLNIEAQGGYRFGRRIGADVFGGLGIDNWRRSIADGRTASGTTVFGYDEDYMILYGKAGVGFFHLLNGWSYAFQGGVKLPLVTYEYVNLGSGVYLEPGPRASAFANIQFDFGSRRNNRFGVALYYDSYRFSESDPELLIDGGSAFLVVQPRSHMDVYGVRVNYYFM